MSLPVLVSPDSFKGTLSAAEAADAIAGGVRMGGLAAAPLPVADGGEGTLDALLAAIGGELLTVTVDDPLGRPIEAELALLEDGRAVVECARASGLALIAEADRDAFAASTQGTGQLIAAAVQAGADSVVVTVGGSATTDGGAGAVAALEEAGVRPRLEVWCDVRTPWEDAAHVFGPQKGADPDTVRRLERRLARLAARAPKDPRGTAMTGAAGGLAGGLWAFCRAQLLPGAPAVLGAAGFDEQMRGARFVITGEGRLDRQTFQGKAVFEVATRARQAGVGCHAIVGGSSLEPFEERILDLQTVSVAGTATALQAAGRRLAELSLSESAAA